MELDLIIIRVLKVLHSTISFKSVIILTALHVPAILTRFPTVVLGCKIKIKAALNADRKSVV